MSASHDILALARQLEANEVAAWRSMYSQLPATLAAQLGVGWHEQGGALVLWNRAAPVFIFNRVLALGVFEPAADALIDSLLAHSHSQKSRCEVQVTPSAQPADLANRLMLRGLRQERAWLMHYRSLAGALPAAAAAPGYRIERVTAASAPAWSDAILAGWQVPAWAATGVLALLLPLAQHPQWSCYLAVHERTGLISGGGALFIDQGVGGLYTDSVRLEHRGRALQRALIAARLAEAQGRGCTLASAQTYVASGAQRNMASLGFEIAYTRLNYAMMKI